MKPFSVIVASVFLSFAAVNAASAQQMVDGKGKTCTSVNKRCYTLGGDAGICEPKFKQCLQTGTFYGNKNTITNLTKR